MTGQQLKNSILQWAIQGKLVPQIESEGTAEDLLKEIRAEKEKLVKEGNLKKKDLEVKPIEDDEIPFEVPESWHWIRLNDIATIGTGATPDTTNPNYYGGSLPWINSSATNSLFIHKPSSFITELAIKETNCTIYDKGTIIVAMYGQGKTRGQVSELMISAATNQACAAISPIIKDTGRFIKYFLICSYLQMRSIAAGGAQPNLNVSKISSFVLPLPPLSEQHRIVAKIEELMPLVEEYGKAQEQLEALNKELPEKLKKSVLQEAIMGKLVPQDPNEGTADELLAEIRKEKENLVKAGKLKKKDLEVKPIEDDEVPFEIPEGWRWCRLGELVTNRAGLAYDKGSLDDKTTPMVRVLRGGNIDYGTWKCKEDDVLISSKYVNDELFLKRGTFITPAVTSLEQMGKTALVEEDQDLTVVGGFVLMLKSLFIEDSYMHYLLHFFGSGYYKEYCKTICNKSGQAFYNLGRSKLMETLVPLPPLAEQKRIVAKLEEVMRGIEGMKSV